MRRRAFLAASAAFTVTKAYAQDAGRKALSGARFMNDGAEFLLADVIAPPLYHLQPTTPAHFEASRALLQSLLPGLVYIEDVLEPTRWNVRRVRARATDGESLQEKLVASGAVRVAPQSDDHAFIKRLLALEETARKEQRGLWALPDYGVFDARAARNAIGAYHLVDGKVLRAEKFGSRVYLNFGEDYRTDFTAGAASRLATRWKREGTDMIDLAGAYIRVRGHVEAINGPSIDLKHVMQIERLD